MDGRFSPVTVGRTGHPPFSPSAYNMGPTSELSLGTNYGGNGNGNIYSNPAYARGVNPIYNVTSNWYASSMGYGMGSNGTGSLLKPSRNMWGSCNVNYTSNSPFSNEFVGSGNGSNGLVSGFGRTGALWGSSSASGHASSNYGNGENVHGLGGGGYGRNSVSSVAPAPSYAATNDVHGGDFGNFYGGGSFYADPNWRSLSPDTSLEVPGLFEYGLGNGASDGMPKNSVGYVG